MNTHALILLAGAAILGAITIAIDAILMRRRRSRRTACLIRHLEDRVSTLEADLAHAEADRDHISEELDDAHLAVLQLTAKRHATWDRSDAEALISMMKSDLADRTGDPSAHPEWRSGWDAALHAYGEPAIEVLRGAIAEIDRLHRQQLEQALEHRGNVADACAAVAAYAAREMERSPFAMVREFHVKFGVPDSLVPDISQHRDLRIKLIEEEFRELRDSLDQDDVLGVADALADLQYVVIGSALQWGIPLDRVFAEVHRSNMTKEGGGKRADGKILKGPDYEPPDIAAALWPCAALDEFHDRELTDTEAACFREHLAGCNRCQDTLHGRMQEQMAVSRGAP